MTEMQSQIGLCELARLDSWNLKNRVRNGEMLIEALKDHPLVLEVPHHSKDRFNSFWWAPFVLDSSKLKCTVKEFVKAMEKEGVPVYTVLWPEMYQEKAYVERNGFGELKYPFNDPNARKIDYTKFDCKTAKWLESRTMSFFTHPVYGANHMKLYIKAFKKVAAAMMK